MVKKYYKLGLILFIISAISYAMMMLNSATNSIDSIWHGVMANSGEWEIVTGRWFWYISDRLQFIICSDPVTSLFAISKYVISVILIIDVFCRCESKILTVIIGLISLVSVSVCSELGFRFQFNAFGFAVLFAVAAFWISTKYVNRFADISIVLLIVLSLGSYQNDIGIICLLVCLYVMRMIIKNEDTLKILKYIGRMLIDGILGCVLYLIILKLFLFGFNYQELDYRGQTSFDIFEFIYLLPERICKTYSVIWNYFNELPIDGVVLYITPLGVFGKVLYTISWVLIGIFLIYEFVKIIKTHDITKIVLYLCMIILLPIATNIILLVADTQLSSYMTLNILYLYVVLLFMSISILDHKSYKIVVGIILGIICYSQFYMVQYDQTAMVEGKEFVSEFVTQISSKLYDIDDLDKKQIVLIGSPAESPMFNKQIFDKANIYAQYGFFYMQECWDGWFGKLNHLNVNIADKNVWSEVKDDVMSDNKDHQLFPHKDSIEIRDDLIIIYISKVSDKSYWN